jgi:hypothetical protein
MVKPLPHRRSEGFSCAPTQVSTGLPVLQAPTKIQGSDRGEVSHNFGRRTVGRHLTVTV